MTTSNLCCQINPTCKCRHCHKSYCPEHSYDLAGASFFAIKDYACIPCHNKFVIEPRLSKSRPGMSFKDLYRECRKITPKGYLSVSVKMLDSNPERGEFEMTWEIYHHSHASVSGKTPEHALAAYKSKVTNEPLEDFVSLETINA